MNRLNRKNEEQQMAEEFKKLCQGKVIDFIVYTSGLYTGISRIRDEGVRKATREAVDEMVDIAFSGVKLEQNITDVQQGMKDAGRNGQNKPPH